MITILGWITKINQTDTSFNGELLGCDGKLYVFQSGCFAPDPVPQTLALTQPISFTPGAKMAVYPLANNICLREETVSPALAALREKVRGRLSEKRYLHCFRVSKIARVFAEKAGCSADKAEVAGLLHDIAKELPGVENVRIISESKLPVSSFELEYHHILHAIAGAILAEKEFGITDPEILDGIRSHNGRPAMGTMEKVIFISDHIDKINKLAENGNYLLDAPTLDEVIFRTILMINQYYAKHRQTPDVITECTMNYMLQSIGKAEEKVVRPDTRSGISDDQFDEALQITVRQSIELRSVSNARQLGGYLTGSGRKVRKNCLVRSARLCGMSREDAATLRALGIDTVIDLRSPEEAAEYPDQNVDLFRYLSCPLPTVELGDYQKKIAEKFAVTKDAKEKTFYLSEYLSCLSMEDMYFEVLTAESSVKSLQSVFAVLLEPDTHGVLFHCTSGKDRTGIVAALIMLSLGACLSDVRADYYASAVATFAATETMAQNLRKEHYSTDAIDEIRYYNGIGKNIAESTYGRVVEDYGSAEAYLSEVLQLSKRQQNLLRDKYLE